MAAQGVQGVANVNAGDALAPAAHIADPSGGVTTDAQARAAIDAILDLLIEQKLMEAS